MRISLIVFVMVAIVLNGCYKSESLVGRWKVKKEYSESRGIWVEFGGDWYIEFMDNHSYSTPPGGPMRGGTYTIDSSVIPNRIVFSDTSHGRVLGAYEMTGRRMILKTTSVKGKDFPADLAIHAGGDYQLVEMERQ